MMESSLQSESTPLLEMRNGQDLRPRGLVCEQGRLPMISIFRHLGVSAQFRLYRSRFFASRSTRFTRLFTFEIQPGNQEKRLLEASVGQKNTAPAKRHALSFSPSNVESNLEALRRASAKHQPGEKQCTGGETVRPQRRSGAWRKEMSYHE